MSDAYANIRAQREGLYKPPPPEELSSRGSSPKSETSWMGNVPARPRYSIQPSQLRKITEVLEYLKCAFDDETTLDTLPLEAAGNSGAWKAWRAYRRSNGSENNLIDSVSSMNKQD